MPLPATERKRSDCGYYAADFRKVLLVDLDRSAIFSTGVIFHLFTDDLAEPTEFTLDLADEAFWTPLGSLEIISHLADVLA